MEYYTIDKLNEIYQEISICKEDLSKKNQTLKLIEEYFLYKTKLIEYLKTIEKHKS